MPELARVFGANSAQGERTGLLRCEPVKIESIQSATQAIAQPAAASGAPGFGDALKRALDGVNASQAKAETMTREFQAENPAVSLEETMVAVTKANIAFQALLQVRNKVVSAYQEIMNMQV
jgi:flagellar hook-basal body complex protein FliE